MHTRFLHLLVLLLAFWTCVEAACGPQLTSIVDLSSDAANAPKIIKKLSVDSVYPYTVSAGDKFQIEFTGTDVGEAYLVAGSAESTLSIGKKPEPPGSVSPSGKPVVSASHRAGLVSLGQLIAAACGVFVLGRSPIKGSRSLLIVLLVGLSSISFISTSVESDCPNISVKIVIPSGKVQNICSSADSTCVCGTDYSGAYCNYYKAKCIPTAQQIANRFNYDTAFPPENIPLPEPGESFCDSNFGSEIWRVSNREPETNEYLVNNGYVTKNNTETFDQRVSIVGAVGFSFGNKYVMGQANGPYAYEVNMDEYNVPHINPTKRILMGYGHETDSNFYNYVSPDITAGAWMTDRHYVFTYGDKLFSMDVSQERNARGGLNVTFIGDLAPFLENSYYPEKLTALARCTNARIFENGTLRILCDIGYGVGTLQKPDYTQIDSHYPNATCINAQYEPGPNTYGRIGYIVFDVASATPSDPSNNVQLYYRWLNGVESDDWYCFQSALVWSHRLNDYKIWVVFNGLNNGYKLNIDRSGQWISNAASDRPDILGWSSPYINPTFKLKLKPWSKGGVIDSRLHGYDGHGAMGWEETMIQSSAPDPCGTCIGYLPYHDIPDDDPDVYVGTSQIGLEFNGRNSSAPWRWSLGLYGSYYHITPNSNGEAVMQGGCDGSRAAEFDCNTIPRAAEVFRITPDDNGSGTLERVASTHDGGYTLYALVTSHCEDPPEPCWALFQSTWGAARHSYNEIVPSDLFIVRFR